MKFEDLGTKTIKSKKRRLGWLIATIFFLLLSIALFVEQTLHADVDDDAYVFYLILFIISSIIYLLTSKNSFYLANNNNKNAVEFFVNKPSKEELNNFIDDLKINRKVYLINKYGKPNKFLSYEQRFNTLQWLNSVSALTKEEYDEKIIDLNNLFSSTNNVIGFNKKVD